MAGANPPLTGSSSQRPATDAACIAPSTFARHSAVVGVAPPAPSELPATAAAATAETTTAATAPVASASATAATATAATAAVASATAAAVAAAAAAAGTTGRGPAVGATAADAKGHCQSLSDSSSSSNRDGPHRQAPPRAKQEEILDADCFVGRPSAKVRSDS
jgi:flagellar hook-length control protein FliK